MGNTCPKHASPVSVLDGAGREVEIREKRVDKTCNERIESRRWLGRLSAWCCGGKTDDSVEIGTPVDDLSENHDAADDIETGETIKREEGVVRLANKTEAKPNVFMGRKALNGYIDFQKYMIDPSHLRITVSDGSDAAKLAWNDSSYEVRLSDLKDRPVDNNEKNGFSESVINLRKYFIDTSNGARPKWIPVSGKGPCVNTVSGVNEAHSDDTDNQAVGNVGKTQDRVRTLIRTNGSFSNTNIVSRLDEDNDAAAKTTRKRKYAERKSRHKSRNMHDNQRDTKRHDKQSANHRAARSVMSAHTVAVYTNTERQTRDSQETNGHTKISGARDGENRSENEESELSTGDNKYSRDDMREQIREVKKKAKFAITQAVIKMDNHNEKSDCPIEVYVRSPYKVEKLRKVHVRVGMKEIKNQRAFTHLGYLEESTKKRGTKREYNDHWAKREIIEHPVSGLAHDERAVHRWAQKPGPKSQSAFFPPPVYECPRRKYDNARQKMGLDNLRNFGIIIQCAEIERVKILSNEFPGVLPPQYMKTWKKEFRRYIKPTDVADND